MSTTTKSSALQKRFRPDLNASTNDLQGMDDTPGSEDHRTQLLEDVIKAAVSKFLPPIADTVQNSATASQRKPSTRGGNVANGK